MKNTDKAKLLDWRVESAALAQKVINGGREGDEIADLATLSESIRSIATAHAITHRKAPTPNEIAETLNSYHGATRLIAHATRTRTDRAESAAATRAEDWLKMRAKNPIDNGHYLHARLQAWCEMHENEAGTPLAAYDDEKRRAAIAALGWELDKTDESTE